MKRGLFALLLLLASAAACTKNDSDSVVEVKVTPGDGVKGITQLQATIALGQRSEKQDFPPQNSTKTVDFPATFSLTMPRSRQGTVSVALTGVNSTGVPVAMGSDSKAVVVGGETSLSITLDLPVVDKKDAASGPDSAPDVQPDVERHDVPGTGGAIGPDGPTATGGTTGSGGITAVDARPGTGGAGGMGGTAPIDVPTATGGATALDAAIDASIDTASDPPSTPDAPRALDGGVTKRTVFDFATGTEGWLLNNYQATDGIGHPVAPINMAVTSVAGLAAPTLTWDGTIGDPPGALKLTAAFNDYDQVVGPTVYLGESAQDWSNKELSVRIKLDPAKATSFTSGGLQLLVSDASWTAPLQRWFTLPADNAWHTYVLDLGGQASTDTTAISQFSLQVSTGGAPASGGPAFTPTTLTAYIDTIQVRDIPSTVTFLDGTAQGLMTGYGWVAFGSSDTVTSPTCSGTLMSSTIPCNTGVTWSTPNALCVTGAIPAVPSGTTNPDYTNNWGISVGANAGPTGSTLGRSFATMAVDFSGTPAVGLRAQVHVKNDPMATNYCMSTTANLVMALTGFNTSCWNNTGTFLALADVPNIDTVTLEVVSGSAAISVTNLCLNGITFGN